MVVTNNTAHVPAADLGTRGKDKGKEKQKQKQKKSINKMYLKVFPAQKKEKKRTLVNKWGLLQ